MTDLTTLFDHVAWADAQALAALRTLPASSPEHAQAARIYAHLAAAEHVWLARLEGRTPAYPVWPDLALDQAAALAEESIAGLRDIARREDASVARVVEYRTSAGQPFRNTVGEILAHVALHGSYHRGQLALLTREGGGAPIATDFIAFVRAAPAPQPAGGSSR